MNFKDPRIRGIFDDFNNNRSRESSSTQRNSLEGVNVGRSESATPHSGPRDETIILCVSVMAVTVIVSVLIVTLAICLQKGRVAQNTITVDGPNPIYGIQYYGEDGERIQSTELRDNNSNYTSPISSWIAKFRDNNSGYLGRNDSRNSAIKNLAHK